MRRCAADWLDPPIARARDNFFVRGLFQANQVSIPIGVSTPDRSKMVPMLANTKLKPNGPLICGLQRFSAPKPSNRADRFASNRISAHGSDSKVVDDWFVVPWDRVPNHFENESRSPPIDCWFGGSKGLVKNRANCSAYNRMSAHGFDSKVVDDCPVVPWERVALQLVDSQPSPPIDYWFGPMRRCAQCCLDPPIARVLGRSIPRCTRNQGARARGHGPMDHYVLCTSWNRYPRLFEADRLLIPWLQTVFSGAETVSNRTDCSA